MLEKPAIPDELILSRLQEAYGLRVRELSFLPLGADAYSASYRAVSGDERVLFLKLRKGAFEETSVTVPLFLHAQGIREILVPLQTLRGAGWADLDEYRLILYPFIEGDNAFHTQFSDAQRVELGKAMSGIHTAQLPAQLRNGLAQETYSSKWRTALRAIQAQVEHSSFAEPLAAQLADSMRTRRAEIQRLIERAEMLAAKVEGRPQEFVLCHSDLHAGNLLVGSGGDFHIVDWDAPILAPKERDLMFIGAGVDRLWPGPRERELFYEGYGRAPVDADCLAYYRYERIVEDIVVECEQVLPGTGNDEDRQNELDYFLSNFAPGMTIEMAREIDPG